MWEWKLSTPEDEYSKSPIINDDRKRNYHVLSQAGSKQQLNELSNSPSFPPTAQTHWNQGTILPWLGQKDERSAKPALLSMVDAVHIACLPYQPSLFSTQHSGSQLQQNRVSEEKVTECKTPMRCVRVCVCVCVSPSSDLNSPAWFVSFVLGSAGLVTELLHVHHSKGWIF